MWVLVVLVRKLALVLAVSLLHHRPDASMRLAVAVLLLALGLHGAVQPYFGRLSSSTNAHYVFKWWVLLWGGFGLSSLFSGSLL
jgi:hypothetical protein